LKELDQWTLTWGRRSRFKGSTKVICNMTKRGLYHSKLTMVTFVVTHFCCLLYGAKMVLNKTLENYVRVRRVCKG